MEVVVVVFEVVVVVGDGVAETVDGVVVVVVQKGTGGVAFV